MRKILEESPESRIVSISANGMAFVLNTMVGNLYVRAYAVTARSFCVVLRLIL